MSELIDTRNGFENFRLQLLATASAAALLGAACEAKADDGADRPTVWVELGGQLERIDGGQQSFAPPFLLTEPRNDFETVSPISVQRLPRYGVGAEGKISFEPEGSDWILSASIRYGRANGSKHLHPQTVVHYTSLEGRHATGTEFSDGLAKMNETYSIADFQAGKDVGLGLFGTGALNFSIRFAQFTNKTTATFGSEPKAFHTKYVPFLHKSIPLPSPYTYGASLQRTASFRGIGPSISLNASIPMAGHPEKSEISFDWGANAALLFGRQKSHVSYQTTEHQFRGYRSLISTLYQHGTSHDRTRFVIVPNVGGFAGLSLKFPNAKVSLGYRADFFFGAMDGGTDVAKKENRGFYGPFANISIGIGG